MPTPAELNTVIDKNEDFVFDLEFFEDDEITPIDVSTWTFNFKLYDPALAVVWNVANGTFNRPSVSNINFTKTIADMAALTGLYSFKLFVTRGTEIVNDVYLQGFYQIQEQ